MRFPSFAAAFAAATLATAAGAATVVVDFNDLTAPGFTGNFGVFASSVGGIAASVNGTPFLAVPSNAGSGAADYTPGAAIVSFTFDWGTPDSYNTLSFFSGNTAVGPSYTGASLAPGTYTFTFLATDNVTRVNFASTSAAFEIDNLSTTTVPEPAAWALMIVGFVMVGAASRRRNSAVAA